LNVLFKQNLDETAILEELDTLFGAYKAERKKGQTLGDYAYEVYLNKQSQDA
jgi:sulfite reductase (NADPH) hemoprotein beta-component